MKYLFMVIAIELTSIEFTPVFEMDWQVSSEPCLTDRVNSHQEEVSSFFSSQEKFNINSEEGHQLSDSKPLSETTPNIPYRKRLKKERKLSGKENVRYIIKLMR